MDFWLEFSRQRWKAVSKMKIYCASQFFNELDLLDIKLHVLDSYVDYFVILESTKTHSGLDKPLYYNDNKNRYKKFHKKIIHQIIKDTPNNYLEVLNRYQYRQNAYLDFAILKRIIDADWFNKNVDSYIRDTYEKEALLYPLFGSGCQKEDIVLLGDLDEIPSPQSIEWLLANFNSEEIYHFRQKMFYYYLNVEKRNEPWIGTMAMSFINFLNNSFCRMRSYKNGIFIENGGWHFTYMGGAEKVLQKVQSWGEQSLNVPRVTKNIKENVENALAKRHDLFFRPADFVVHDINKDIFPKYIIDHQQKFSHMILSD